MLKLGAARSRWDSFPSITCVLPVDLTRFTLQKIKRGQLQFYSVMPTGAHTTDQHRSSRVQHQKHSAHNHTRWCYTLHVLTCTSKWSVTDTTNSTQPTTNQVTIRFRENTAVLASSLLVSRLGPCSWFSLAPPYFNDSYILEWPLWDFG